MKPLPSFLIVIAASGMVFAQTGWRRAEDAPPAQAAVQQQDPTQPVAPADAYGQRQASQPAAPRPYGIPAQLTLKPGTYLTVRINEELSTSHNQPGDPFTATLMQPVVVDGIVVAQAGQNVYGRVAEAEKQHSDKPSRLALQLTGLSLVDGTQATLHSQLVTRRGGTTPAGQQVGTVATTTAMGAAVGAAADWGTGAAIGAGAGAAAGLVGVLLTRNHPTVIYPETALTFETTAPLTVSTVNAPQAFRYVGPEDYQKPTQLAQTRPELRRPAYFYGPGYYYPYYPYFWGTGVSLWWGPRYFVGRGFYRHR